jgi:hypothetical protein
MKRSSFLALFASAGSMLTIPFSGYANADPKHE